VTWGANKVIFVFLFPVRRQKSIVLDISRNILAWEFRKFIYASYKMVTHSSEGMMGLWVWSVGRVSEEPRF
jgi:hypothetical protein